MPNQQVGRVALNVSGGSEARYKDWPVTQGIPFPDGVLKCGTPVRIVDRKGKQYPTQATCLATWRKDMEYVKWLLVDFQTDHASGSPAELFLEYGPEAVPPPSPATVRITTDDHYLHVDTGEMRLRLRNTYQGHYLHSERDFFAGCWVKAADGWREVLAPKGGLSLHMKDRFGNLYDSVQAGPRCEVVVEEEGPLRSCIRVSGYLASPHGVRFCPFILRMHVFAGKSDIRLFHTFIFDQEPHDVELSVCGIRLALLNDGGDRRFAAGVERGALWTSKGEPLAMLQSSDQEYRVELGGQPYGKGRRGAGWASINGRNASAMAAFRYFWQEHPKGFTLGPQGLDIHVWPESFGKTLAFTTPFEEPAILFKGERSEENFKKYLAERPTAPLNLKSITTFAGYRDSHDMFLWIEEMVEKHARNRTVTYNDTGTDNGEGAAKTTELFLCLKTQSISDEEGTELAAAVQEPLIAPATPEHTCATGALGYAYHAGDQHFKEIDAALDDILRLIVIEPIEKCRLYGMMRYGNMVCSHAPGPAWAYVHYKDSHPEKALRFVGPYNNEANDQISSIWGNFVRSGSREHYFLAQRYSRTVADVATIHSRSYNPNVVGLMHYHNCHQWSGGGSPSHTLIRGLLIDYFFTGNRRLFEVARETADLIVKTQEPAGIVSCRNGTLHREFTGPLWNLLEMYEATWDGKYGDLARRSLNWFLRTLPEPGNYPISVYTRGEQGDEAVVEPPGGVTGHARDVGYLFQIALRLFDSRPLREHILAEANHYVWDELTDNYITADMAQRLLSPRSKLWQVDEKFYWTNWATPPLFGAAPTLVCAAYDLTGDPIYAAWAKDTLEGAFLRHAGRMRRFADFRFTYINYGAIIPALVRTVATAIKNDPAGLAKAEIEWRRRRAAMSMPVYSGPGVDLDKDVMDTSGNIISRLPAELPCQAPGRKCEPVINLGRLSTESP